MYLYLRYDLLKSESSASKGEQRGGSYAARIQIGMAADGSPRYRYFKTEAEYSEYLKNKQSKGKNAEHGHQKGSGDLEQKVKKEHEESTEKQKKHGLLASDHAEKSLRLFVRI